MSPAGLILLAVVWSALVWGAAHLLCRFRPAPRTAQAIWRAGALLMFTPFAAALVVPGLPAFTAAPLPELPVLEPLFIQPDTDFIVAEAQASFRLPGIGLVLIALVAGGWAVRFALWLASQFRLQRLKARARRVRRPLDHWAEAVGLARVPDIRVIPTGAPFLAGLARPIVFVPSALINTADAPQVIVHEMVHLKRGDLIARPLERLAADLVWFSPFAWMIRERLDYWREAVVDQAAAELTGDRIAYARALTRAARLARPVVTLPVAALILAKEGSLKMRLTELLSETPRRPRRLGGAAIAALVLATPLALAQGMLIKGAGGLPVAPAPLDSAWYSHPVLDKAKLTSTFGERKHPITGKLKTHNGVDLAEAEGVPVFSPVAGWVTRAEFTEAYGNLVEVSAGETVLRFAQLKDINVETGGSVTPGQVVGTLGQSGQATGPHLHLEVWHGGEVVDPQTVDGLVLARELKVAAGAKPLAPLAPVAPPEAAAAPTPAPRPVRAKASPAACDATGAELKALPRPLGWDVRLSVAGATNAVAGLGSETYAPETIIWPQPTYPVEGAQQGLSASCDVMFDLGTDGLPKNAQAHCSSSLFEESAAALPGAKFKPATNASGKPVEVQGVIYPLQYCIE